MLVMQRPSATVKVLPTVCCFLRLQSLLTVLRQIKYHGGARLQWRNLQAVHGSHTLSEQNI